MNLKVLAPTDGSSLLMIVPKYIRIFVSERDMTPSATEYQAETEEIL
jgi:hypothetical protein